MPGQDYRSVAAVRWMVKFPLATTREQMRQQALRPDGLPSIDTSDGTRSANGLGGSRLKFSN